MCGYLLKLGGSCTIPSFSGTHYSFQGTLKSESVHVDAWHCVYVDIHYTRKDTCMSTDNYMSIDTNRLQTSPAYDVFRPYSLLNQVNGNLLTENV